MVGLFEDDKFFRRQNFTFTQFTKNLDPNRADPTRKSTRTVDISATCCLRAHS